MDEYEEKILEYIDWVKPGLARQLGWRLPLRDRDTDIRDAWVGDWFVYWSEEENKRVLDIINKKLREDTLENLARYKLMKEEEKKKEEEEEKEYGDKKLTLIMDSYDEYMRKKREIEYQKLLDIMDEIEFELAYSYEDILVHPRLLEEKFEDIYEFAFTFLIEDIALWLLEEEIGTTVFFCHFDCAALYEIRFRRWQ